MTINGEPLPIHQPPVENPLPAATTQQDVDIPSDGAANPTATDGDTLPTVATDLPTKPAEKIPPQPESEEESPAAAEAREMAEQRKRFHTVQGFAHSYVLNMGKEAMTAKSPTEQQQAAIFLYKLHIAPIGMFVDPRDATKDGLHVNIVDKVAHATDASGTLITAIKGKVKGADGQIYFVCTLSAGSETTNIHANELYGAQIITEQARLAPKDNKNVSGALDEYTTFLTANNPRITAEAVTTVEDAAKSLKLTSSDTVEVLLETFQVDDAKKAAIRNLLEGKIYADSTTMAHVLYQLDFHKAPEKQFDKWISDLRTKRLKAEGEDVLRYDAQIEVFGKKKDELIKDMKKIGENKDAVIKNMEATFNSMDTDQYAICVAAIGTGKTEEALEMMLEHIPADKKEMAMQILKFGGIGAAALLALLIMQGMQGGK